MAAYIIAKSADVPNHGFAVIEITNGKEIIMFRRNGTLYALDRFCPHQGAPLDQGLIIGNMIKCGLHGFLFDLKNGEGVNCPGYQIQCYAVQEKDPDIFLSY